MAVLRRAAEPRWHRARAALRSRRHRTLFVSIGVTMVALFTLVIVVGVGLSRGTPAWWTAGASGETPTGEPDADEVERGAVLENLIINRAYAHEGTPTPSGAMEWAVSLPERDVNAWLNTRLPKWLNNQGAKPVWPVEVSRVLMRFEDGVIRLGTRVTRDGITHVYSATVLLSLERADRRGGGELWLRTPWLWVGRLPIPSGLVLGRLRADPSRDLPSELSRLPQTKDFLDALSGNRPIIESLSLRLEDGRRVRVTRLEVREGRLSVWCVTEPAR
jgi:hypothetical protein